MNALQTHRHRAAIALILLVGLLTIFARSSFAAANSYAGLTQAQSIINNTGPLSLASSQSGLVVTAANDAVVTTSAGRTVSLPVSAAALVDRKAMALTAAKIIRGANAIGLAFTAYEVYTLVKESGVTTCAPPNFFCKPAPATNTAPTGARYDAPGHLYEFSTALEAAQARANDINSQNGCTAGMGPPYCGVTVSTCTETGPANYGSYDCLTNSSAYQHISGNRDGGNTNCPAGSTLTNGSCVGAGGTPQPIDNEADLSDYIANSSGWPTGDAVRQYNAIRHDGAAIGLKPGDMMPDTTPLTVTAPEVALPPAVVKTQTLVQPDGSTVTRETSQQTTVIPNIPWARVGDAATKPATFAEKTTTTVTDIQPDGTRKPVSQTVATPVPISTSADTTTKPAADAGPKECGSPGHPKCAIDEEGTPDAKDFDQEKDIKKIQDANDARQAEYDKIGGGGGGGAGGGGSSGIHTNWLPQIPTTACENPKVPNPITGAVKEIDICTPVGYFRSIFAAVFAFFCIYGSVRQIEAAIKA